MFWSLGEHFVEATLQTARAGKGIGDKQDNFEELKLRCFELLAHLEGAAEARR